MQEDTANTILGIIFIFIIICSIALFVFYSKILPKIKESQKPEEKDYSMRINCPVNSQYVLKYKNVDIASGNINKNSIEMIQNLTTNREYELYCWNDDGDNEDYYFAHRTCINATECNLKLYKEGKISTDYEVYNTNIDYFIEVDDGILREAILCIAWQGFYKLYVNLNEHEIPENLKSYVDKCYFLGTRLNRSEDIKIIFDKAQRNAEIEIRIIDYCNIELEEGYFDCGIEDYIEKIHI